MEKVVYLLGAGFSAPLGLPVMSNFYMKSKDMFISDDKRYAHFAKVFDTIKEMSVIKNYFSTDLFNIEEILSILEMRDYLEGKNNSDEFKKYISDVIEYHTPKIQKHNGEQPGNWYDFVFGSNNDINLYGYFIANLAGINIMINTNFGREFHLYKLDSPSTTYSIITLNYDLIIENILNYLHENYYCTFDIWPTYGINNDKEYSFDKLNYAKLHGTLGPDSIIVPPTWNKGNNIKLLSSWKLARKLLEEANHIRIIGYSLPVSDAYIKYLLKSSILDSFHLKSIDVLNLDPSGEIKKRYDDFIEFSYYRFINCDVLKYLEFNLKKHKDNIINNGRISSLRKLEFNLLEQAHRDFMDNN